MRPTPKKSEISGWRDDLLSEEEKQETIRQIIGDKKFNEISKKADNADAMHILMNENEKYQRQIKRKNNEKLKSCKLDKEDKRYLKEIFRCKSLPKEFITAVELCIKDYIHIEAQGKPPTKKQTLAQLKQLAKLAGKIDNDIKELRNQLKYDEETESLIECAFIENQLAKLKSGAKTTSEKLLESIKAISKSGAETTPKELLKSIEAIFKDFQYPFILALDKVKTEFIPHIKKPENNPRANLAFRLGELTKIFLGIEPTSTDSTFVCYILEKIKGWHVGDIHKDVMLPATRKLKSI